MDYWALAELRYRIRRFLRTREETAPGPPASSLKQYLLLLQAKALRACGPVTLGDLASGCSCAITARSDSSTGSRDGTWC